MRASRKVYGSNSFFQSSIKILYHPQDFCVHMVLFYLKATDNRRLPFSQSWFFVMFNSKIDRCIHSPTHIISLSNKLYVFVNSISLQIVESTYLQADPSSRFSSRYQCFPRIPLLKDSKLSCIHLPLRSHGHIR